MGPRHNGDRGKGEAGKRAEPATIRRGGVAFPVKQTYLVRMISQKAKYALRALMSLAKAGPETTLRIADIAAADHIPQKFLERILLDLRNRGYVASRRGSAGGYMLLKPANEITYGEILRLIDGPIAPLPCLSLTAYRRCEDCGDEAACEIRQVFQRVAVATREVLDKTTIADSLGAKSGARARARL